MDLKEARQNQTAERHPWERARLEVVTGIVRKYAQPAVSGPVVDIGCGDTWLVEQLASRLPERDYYAVDPGFEALELAAVQERLALTPIRVFRGMDDVVASGAANAELVLLLDVLEHVEDDAALLTELRHGPLVDDDTRLVITVPAWQELFCSHDEFLGHHRRYTSELLRERLETAGYVIEETGYFFYSLMLARYAQMLLEKARGMGGTARGVGRTRALPLVDGAISAALVLDYRFCRLLTRLGVHLPGLSLFAVARPR